MSVKGLLRRVAKGVFRRIVVPIARPLLRYAKNWVLTDPELMQAAKRFRGQLMSDPGLADANVAGILSDVRERLERLEQLDLVRRKEERRAAGEREAPAASSRPADAGPVAVGRAGAEPPPYSGEALREILTRELGWRGSLAAQGLWFNQGLRLAYQPGFAVEVVGVNERVVEIPFVLGRLPRDAAAVLDLGSAESMVPLQIASSTGSRVVAVDYRPYPLRHPRLDICRADLRSLPFRDGSFDAVVSLSTVEHVGLGHYGDPTEEDGDRCALREAHRVLPPAGRFLGTFPLGSGVVTDLQRLYDPEVLLDSLLGPLFAAREVVYGVSDPATGQWILSPTLPDLDRSPDNTSVQAVLLFDGTRR
jgi:SAM-dependent methyltransferase